MKRWHVRSSHTLLPQHWHHWILCLTLSLPVGNRPRPLLAQTVQDLWREPTALDKGNDPFARYTTPGQCEQAAIRLRRQYWRDKREDTVHYAPTTDSVPISVIAAARMCAARFQVQTVPERELLNLAQLSLWAHQTDAAELAIKRLLQATEKTPKDEWGWTLYQVTTSILSAQPSLFPMAQTYLRRLDTGGTPAALWRMLAHTEAAQYALSINDLDTAEQEGRAAIVAMRESSRDDQIDWLWKVYATYRTVAKARALLELVGHGTPRTSRTMALTVFDSASVRLKHLYAKSMTPQQQQIDEAVTFEGRPFQLLGMDTLPGIHASAWYGDSNTTAPVGKRPRHDRVSLLVFVDASCGYICYPQYATVRRLQAKYASATANGAPTLEVLLLASTHGYFREQLLASPKNEADSTGSYFLRFLQLPAVVVVEETKFSHIPDGRRQNEETENHKAYYREHDAVLIDPQGTVQWVDNLSPQTEATWDAVIGHVIRAVPFYKHSLNNPAKSNGRVYIVN